MLTISYKPSFFNDFNSIEIPGVSSIIRDKETKNHPYLTFTLQENECRMLIDLLSDLLSKRKEICDHGLVVILPERLGSCPFCCDTSKEIINKICKKCGRFYSTHKEGGDMCFGCSAEACLFGDQSNERA